jgi:hypothetical protein
MEAILRTNDIIALNSASAFLAADGIAHETIDQFTANLEGSISAIPRRIVVAPEDAPRARALLRETGLFDGDVV